MWMIELEEYRIAMGSKLSKMSREVTAEQQEWNWNVVPSPERTSEVEQLFDFLVGEYGQEAMSDRENCLLF